MNSMKSPAEKPPLKLISGGQPTLVPETKFIENELQFDDSRKAPAVNGITAYGIYLDNTGRNHVITTVVKHDKISLTRSVRKFRLRGEDRMPDGYERLIDRLDQDMRDHKQEIRDRDARLQKEMQEREERNHEDAKEREQRILSAVSEIKQSNKELGEKLEKKIEEGNRHIQLISVTTIVGIAGMVIAIIIGILWPTLHQTPATPTSNAASSNTTQHK